MTNQSLTDAEANTTDTTPTVAVPVYKLGDHVTYISGKGKQKLALVLGTPETIEEGSSLGFTLKEGQATLLVFSPSGRQEYKKHVDFAGIAAANTDQAPVRVWQPTE